MEETGHYRGSLHRILSEGIQVEKTVAQQKQDPGHITVLNSRVNFHQARPIRIQTSDYLF